MESITLTYEEIKQRYNSKVIKGIMHCMHGMSRTDELLHISYTMAYILANNCDTAEAAQITFDGLIEYMRHVIDHESKTGSQSVQ